MRYANPPLPKNQCLIREEYEITSGEGFFASDIEEAGRCRKWALNYLRLWKGEDDAEMAHYWRDKYKGMIDTARAVHDRTFRWHAEGRYDWRKLIEHEVAGVVDRSTWREEYRSLQRRMRGPTDTWEQRVDAIQYAAEQSRTAHL